MEWLKALDKDTEEKCLRISLNESQYHVFCGSSTGSYKLTHEPSIEVIQLKIKNPIDFFDWKVKLRLEIHLKSSMDGISPLYKEFEFYLTCDIHEISLISWSIDDMRPYCEDDNNYVEWDVTLKVLEHEETFNSTIMPVLQNSCEHPDVTLIVDKKPLAIQKSILCRFSKVLKEMLDGDDVINVEIKDVAYDEFSMFVAVMHGFKPNFCYETYDYLFKLCTIFDAPCIRSTLIQSSKDPSIDSGDKAILLRLAEEHLLTKLRALIVESCKYMQQIEQVSRSKEFSQVSEASQTFFLDQAVKAFKRKYPYFHYH